MFRFDLGQEAEDILTGFKGIIMGRTEYLTGCDRYGLMPRKVLSDGRLPIWEWFDESLLKLTGKSLKLNAGKESVSKPGGPQPSAPSR